MARAIPKKWLADIITVETGYTYDSDRNKIATTDTVSNVAVTNIKRMQADGNGAKVLADSLLLICDSRSTLTGGTVFVPVINKGITWNGNKYTVQSVTPFRVKGVLHHYEAYLI